MDADESALILSSAQLGLTRAEGLWFADCGLIIQAESTLFRISRDYLAAHSPVFRDMLSLPTPPDADIMDGCPFVRLPDSAADVTVFFKALLYPGFFEAFPAPTTFAILSGVLRLSHKYEVDVLRKRALIHISSFHPTTLHEWEQLEGKTSPWADLCIVFLARPLSIDWILPTTFYRICHKTPEESLLMGYGPYELTAEDKIRCMATCRVIETTAVTRILDFLWSPVFIHGCEHPEECMESRFRRRRAVEGRRERTSEEAAIIPLGIWKEEDWEDLEVCDVCLSTMKTTHQQAKQSFWDGLPAMFGLPEWTELEKMKTEALQ
ncbi:hypothetical protein C8R44DRAFT_642011 [Mycena epipterygia]|nr:hypothetical protein C8R44DRAFT_642011 [Mycena epipterygia]